MTHAFRAMIRINFVDGFALINSIIGTFWFTDVAVDAFFSDFEGHNYKSLVTHSGTNALTSPFNAMISRTIVAEIERWISCDDKKTVSIVFFDNSRFMFAISIS